jgi:peptidyl-prolyl cis-trans isomerase D
VLKQVEDKVAEGKTMQEIASELNGGIKTAAKVNFSAFSVPGLGIEPKISGTAPYLNVDEISEPLAGNLGVYLVKVTNVNEPENVNPQTEKDFLYRSLTSRISYLTFEALKERASIVDNRSKFY